MLRSMLMILTVAMGLMSAAQAAEDRVVGFQIPNNKADLNNLLGSIPILGDVTTATDIDEKVFILAVKDNLAVLYIDGQAFELGTASQKYQFSYLNKQLTLDLGESTIISQSLIEADEDPVTHELVMVFDSAVYTDQINVLRSEVRASTRVIDDQSDLLANAEKIIITLQDSTNEMGILEDQMKARDAKIMALEARIAELNANIGSLQDQLSETNQIIAGQNAQLADAGVTINTLAETARQVVDLEKLVSDKDKERADLVSQLDEMTAEIHSLENALTGANNIITDQLNQLDELEQASARLAELETVITALNAEVASLEAQLSKANAAAESDSDDSQTINN